MNWRGRGPVWPRKLSNFPIILLAVMHQYVGAVATMVDSGAAQSTGLHILLQVIRSPSILEVVLIMVPTIAWLGFFAQRKVTTLICLVPQQLFLYLSAGSALRAIALGEFANGTVRTSAFIAADESLTVLLAIFHTWAMLLILRHGSDR